MTVEEYLAALQELAAAHPGARVMATDAGDDYDPGGDYDARPAWSERDQVIYADSGEEETTGTHFVCLICKRELPAERGHALSPGGSWICTDRKECADFHDAQLPQLP